MQQYYQSFYQKARDLEHRYQDVVDQPNLSSAQSLRRDMLALIDDFEQDKAPRSIEDRIKRIVSQVERLRAEGEVVMNFTDLDYFRKYYEEMQREIRKLPNY
jgi:hypothetical protein